MASERDPLPAPEPGLYPAIDEKIYHRWEGLSSHRLGDIADGKTPARLRWEMDHPEEKESDSKDLGTMVHAAILQPHRLSELAVPGPSEHKKTAKDRAAWAKAAEENPHAVILRPSAWERGMRQVEAAMAHPYLRKILAMPGESEIGVVTMDAQTGVASKALIDRWIPGINTVLDLKTTRATTYEEFRRDCEKFAYYRQAAHYVDTMAEAGCEVRHYLIGGLESTAPHFIQLYEIPSDFIEMGRQELSTARTVLSKCYMTGEWPGYSEKIQVMEPSHWLVRKHAHLFD